MTQRPAVNQDDVRLPENAFRELKPGENYEPVIPAATIAPEVTIRSIVQGFTWSIIFSAAATYIALKLGQGIESAIPISILAVGFSVFAVKFMKRRGSTLLENVNVLAFGAASSLAAVAGALLAPTAAITPTMGRVPLILSLIVVIASGMDKPWKIFLLAVGLGLVSNLGAYLLGPQWSYVLLLGGISLLLVLRPSGLAARVAARDY